MPRSKARRRTPASEVPLPPKPSGESLSPVLPRVRRAMPMGLAGGAASAGSTGSARLPARKLRREDPKFINYPSLSVLAAVATAEVRGSWLVPYPFSCFLSAIAAAIEQNLILGIAGLSSAEDAHSRAGFDRTLVFADAAADA